MMDEQKTAAHPAPFECSATLGQLGAALAKAQGEFPEAKKSGIGKVGAQGSQRAYPYATLSDVIEAVRGPLAKNGLAVIQPPFNDTEGAASVRTVLLHESGEWLAGVVTIPTASHGAAAHALGSAIAYCRRYGMTSLLGIATEDDDGATANDAGPRQSRQDARQTPAPESRGDAAAQTPADHYKRKVEARLAEWFPGLKGPLMLQLIGTVLKKEVMGLSGWTEAHYGGFLARLEKLTAADRADLYVGANGGGEQAPELEMAAPGSADDPDLFDPSTDAVPSAFK